MNVSLRSLKKKSIIIIAGLTIVALLSPLAAFADDPHEDPEQAQTEFSGVSLFRYYSASLDFVLKKTPEEVKTRLEKMPFANIPQSLKGETDDFSSYGIGVASLVFDIDKDLSQLRTLVGQSRLDEASLLAKQISAKLADAEWGVKNVELATTATGRKVTVSSSPAGSDLRRSYDEVTENIEKIRGLLNLDKKLLANLPRILAEKSLNPVKITFKVEPVVAFVGDDISFEGTIASEDEPLSGREIDILLDGTKFITIKTDASGHYDGKLSLPYRYVPELDLQALYYPRDKDADTYLAAVSQVVKVKVLFYEVRFGVKVETRAYPGLETMVSGKFDFGQYPPPKERKVEIYLDDVFVTEVITQGVFSTKIYVAPKTDVGKHIITLAAAATGRYSPIAASAILEVTKAIPVLYISLPKVAIIPGNLQLSGNLLSEVGPVSEASMKMRLGQSQVESVSSANGTFKTSMKMPMSLGLVGWQELETEVIPREPWHAPLKTTNSILAVNLVNSAGALAIIALLGIYLPGQLRKRFGLRQRKVEKPAIAVITPEPAPAHGRQPAITAAVEPAFSSSQEPAGRILYWYRLAVRLLQGTTKTLVSPHQTLREFANESSRALGPFARHFVELTRMVEKLLYSQYLATEEDAQTSEQLAHNIEGMAKGEGI